MHSLVNGYKKVLSVAVATDYDWDSIKELKDRIANPEQYASAAPVVEETKEEAEEEEEKKEEDKEESDEEMGFGDLFG